MPLTFITLGTRVGFVGSLVVFLSEVGFVLDKPTGLTLEELEAGLLCAGKDRLSLGLLAIVVLELFLKSVRWKDLSRLN